MSWLSIIQLVLKAVSGLTDYLNNRKLLEAGQALIIKEGLQLTLDNIGKSNAAIAEIRTNPGGKYASKLREKYTRPDE